MKFTIKHFPFLLLLFSFYSCNKESSKEIIKSSNYSALIEKANVKESTLELDSTFYYLYQAKLSCDSNQKEEKAYALYRIALIQKTNCDFVGLEETATEALDTYDDEIYNINFYNFLGIAYKELLDFDNSLLYYNKTYNLASKEIDKIIVKNNIAVSYLEQNNFKKTFEILEPLLKNDTLIHNKVEFARVTDNLGFAYYNINNDSLAKIYLENSLKIRDSISNDYEKIASYVHLSKFYFDKKPELAKEFAQNAYQFATNVNSPDDRLEALDLLIKNPTNKNAISHYERYHSLNDSITKVRQTNKNQFSKIKYDFKIAIERSEKLKIEKDFITYLFLGFGIITILIYFLIRSKNKRRIQKSVYETEIRISKRLHDELANDVYNTMTYAETQDLSDLTKKEKFLNQIETIYNRTRNISLENSEIDTGKNFKENLSNLISSYDTDQTNIILKNFDAIDWNTIKKNTKITIHRILQELLINMKKHSQSSLVVLGFESKNKTYEINYSDNGIGSSDKIHFKNGLLNVENRIKTIKGTFTFETESQKGFKAKIVFPK